MIRVDQQPLGNTPTSNPATYTGVFDLIRTLYLPTARGESCAATRRGGSASTCPAGAARSAKGTASCGSRCTFCPTCGSSATTCRGRRYNPETLGRHVITANRSPTCSTCRAAGRLKLFENIPKIRRILQTLCDVGLDYLPLGQPAPTLSGGEAQRVKLAAELARPDTGRTLYLLDEPTTGLHFDDMAKLLDVLNRLVDLGNTVVVIEHNLDVIKTADWVIDMGPEAGEGGGYVVAAGTPEDVVHAQAPKPDGRQPQRVEGANWRSPPSDCGLLRLSRTPARCWRRCWPPARTSSGSRHDFAAARGQARRRPGHHRRRPRRQNAWEADGRRWHTRDRVGRNGQPAAGTGGFWTTWSIASRSWASSAPTNWNDRTWSKSAAAKKADGWFLHAITGEEWLLKLKFRVAKATFQRDDWLRNST